MQHPRNRIPAKRPREDLAAAAVEFDKGGEEEGEGQGFEVVCLGAGGEFERVGGGGGGGVVRCRRGGGGGGGGGGGRRR